MYFFLGCYSVEDTCAIVADEISRVDDIALNAPEGASVAKSDHCYAYKVKYM
jgi:hypothetical protein